MANIRPKDAPRVAAVTAGDSLSLDGTILRSILTHNLGLRGADILSAATLNLETATGDLVDVTGTTAITAITLSDGHARTVRFTGILTLTNGASLVLPSAANITTAAGDFAVFRGYAAGVVRAVDYVRASGSALAGGTGNVVAANNGSEFTNPATFRSNLKVPVMGYVYGLNCSSAGGSAQFSVTAGEAMSSNGADLMSVATTYAKVATVAWSVGSGGGALDTGTLTSGTWYYIHIIKRPDTSVTDYAVSTSAIAPTTGGSIPSAYTLSQCIGAFKAVGGPVVGGFSQLYNKFYHKVGFQDAASTSVGTSRGLLTLSAPPNSIALFRAYGYNSGAVATFVIQPTAETDRAPGAFISLTAEVANQGGSGHFALPVDASSQIAVRSSVAASTINVETFGFEFG